MAQVTLVLLPATQTVSGRPLIAWAEMESDWDNEYLTGLEVNSLSDFTGYLITEHKRVPDESWDGLTLLQLLDYLGLTEKMEAIIYKWQQNVYEEEKAGL